MRPTWRFISVVLPAMLLVVAGASWAADLPKDAEKLPPGKAVDAYLAVMEDDTQTNARRNYAEMMIVRMGDPAVGRIIELYGHAGAERRGRLAKILAQIPKPSASTVAVLLDDLKKSGPGVDPYVVLALADLKAAQASSLMLEILPRAPDGLRFVLLNALGRLADEKAADALFEGLDSKDRLVRTVSADGLIRLLTDLRAKPIEGGKDSYHPLMKRVADYIENGSSSESRRILVAELGRVGDPDASGILRQVARTCSGEIQIAAVGSLATLKCADAVGDLVRLLRSKDPILRHRTLEALASIGKMSCVPDLVDMLEGSEPQERREVVEALRRLTNQPFGDNPAQWRLWWEREESGAER